jgi:hypothetical protein
MFGRGAAVASVAAKARKRSGFIAGTASTNTSPPSFTHLRDEIEKLVVEL